MLSNPLVKVDLPIPHAIAADLHAGNAAPLAAPLGEGFNRQPGYRGNLNWSEQLCTQTRSIVIARAWSFALDGMLDLHFFFRELSSKACRGRTHFGHHISSASRTKRFARNGIKNRRALVMCSSSRR
jgi:hypothetical protein